MAGILIGVMLGLVLDSSGRTDPSGTATVQVAILTPMGKPVADAMVLAEPLTSSQAALPEPTRTTAHGGSVVLKLGNGAWRLTPILDGHLGETAQVLVAEGRAEQDEVSLVLWPIGRVGGSLESAGPRSLTHLTVSVMRRAEASGSFGRPLLEPPYQCPVNGSRWECQVPAGIPLDLQLRAEGYAPVYLWNVQASQKRPSKHLTVTLFRGSSLVGWVLGNDGKPLPSDTEIALAASDGGSVKADKAGAYMLKAGLQSHGFFQIVPAPPGRYHLSAKTREQVTEKVMVSIGQDGEERLSSPLILRQPASLTLRVDPPTDSLGNPWLVRLVTWRGQHSGHLLVAGQPVSGEGSWAKDGLAPGQYRIYLQTAVGATWYDKALDLDSGNTDLNVVIKKVVVRGTVSFGVEPLAGHVALVDYTSGARVRFKTDQDGEFFGEFPSIDLDKAWWSADIESALPSVRRSLRRVRPEQLGDMELRFVLALPDGVLEGRVVDEAGSPQSAVVNVSHRAVGEAEDGVMSLTARTIESTGKFTVPGLADGEYRVYATDNRRGDQEISEAVAVSVRSGKSTPITLTLRSASVIKGKVSVPGGAGVPGATVAVVPADRTDLGIRLVRTDADGGFSLRVPVGTRHVIINVWAVGVGRRTLGRVLPPDGILDLQLDPGTNGMLTFDLAEAESSISLAYLYHDGGFIPLAHLQQWSQQNGYSPDSSFKVPLTSPGHYRVCRLMDFRLQYAAFMMGNLPAGLCSEGVLPPGGELRIGLPALPKSPAER